MTLGREKLHFLNSPTPITYLSNISEELGVNLYLKRDDLTNFGTGGNKLRKLEYLVKDALDQGATMLLTVGGAQTNHGRLTAAVAAKYGLKAAIVAVDSYPGEMSANLLLDGIMGCPVYLVQADGVRTSDELEADAVKKITEEWEAKGEKVYFIPVGGSNEIGALGYYDCGTCFANKRNAACRCPRDFYCRQHGYLYGPCQRYQKRKSDSPSNRHQHLAEERYLCHGNRLLCSYENPFRSAKGYVRF